MARVTRYTLAAAMAGLATLASIASVVVGHAQPRPPLAMTTFFESKWPSRPAWSPDGRFVSFLWTDWAGQELYVAERSGGAPIQLTKTGDYLGGSTWNSSGSFGVWSPDSRSIVYGYRGDLYLVSVPGGETTRLTETSEGEDGARFSPDGGRLAYGRGGNLYVIELKTNIVRQVTKEGRSGGATWSPDGKWISTSTGEPTQRLTSSPPYSGPLMVHVGSRFNERDALLVSSDGKRSQIVEKSPDNESITEWSPDSTRFVLERTSIDVKDRTLFLCDVEPLACKPFLQSSRREISAVERSDGVVLARWQVDSLHQRQVAAGTTCT